MQKTTPFLMFVGEQHGKAEEAVRFYASLSPNSEITYLDRYGSGEGGPEGTLKFAAFTLGFQEDMAIDSAWPTPLTSRPQFRSTCAVIRNKRSTRSTPH